MNSTNTRSVYGPAIVEYVTFLTEKVNFHKAHPEFEGILNLDEYMKKIAGGVPRPEKLYEKTYKYLTLFHSLVHRMEVIGHLLDLQDACLKMDRHVFSVKSPKDLTECRVASLIPLTLESYAIYTMVVFMLKKLVDRKKIFLVIYYSISKSYSLLTTFFLSFH
jgi:huntingtin-interacting protein 1-related protein